MSRLSPSVRDDLLSRVLSMHSPLGDSLVSNLLVSSDLPTINAIAALIRDPKFNGVRWSIAVQGTASANPAIRRSFASALISGTISDDEADRLATAIQKVSKTSFVGITTATDIPAEQRAALLAAYDQSLPHKMRSTNLTPSVVTDCQALYSSIKGK